MRNLLFKPLIMGSERTAEQPLRNFCLCATETLLLRRDHRQNKSNEATF